MRLPLAIATLALTASPALAQFPPPGIYLCINGKGAPIGTMSLFVAGDYDWTAEGGGEGKGQIASAGNSLEALSGPLKDIAAKGTFSVDAFGAATFALSSTVGELSCGLPPEEPKTP